MNNTKENQELNSKFYRELDKYLIAQHDHMVELYKDDTKLEKLSEIFNKISAPVSKAVRKSLNEAFVIVFIISATTATSWLFQTAALFQF